MRFVLPFNGNVDFTQSVMSTDLELTRSESEQGESDAACDAYDPPFHGVLPDRRAAGLGIETELHVLSFL